MDRILTAWSTRDLQTAKNIWLQLHSHGKTLKDLEKHLAQLTRKRNHPKDSSLIRKPTRVCPECNGTMFLIPLRNNPTYRSYWECCKTCKSSGCGYTIYNEQSIDQIMSNY